MRWAQVRKDYFSTSWNILTKVLLSISVISLGIWEEAQPDLDKHSRRPYGCTDLIWPPSPKQTMNILGQGDAFWCILGISDYHACFKVFFSHVA